MAAQKCMETMRFFLYNYYDIQYVSQYRKDLEQVITVPGWTQTEWVMWPMFHFSIHMVIYHMWEILEWEKSATLANTKPSTIFYLPITSILAMHGAWLRLAHSPMPYPSKIIPHTVYALGTNLFSLHNVYMYIYWGVNCVIIDLSLLDVVCFTIVSKNSVCERSCSCSKRYVSECTEKWRNSPTVSRQQILHKTDQTQGSAGVQKVQYTV